MLRVILGPPEIVVFEFKGKATDPEQEWRRHISRNGSLRPCIVGLAAGTRDEMTLAVFGGLQRHPAWRAASKDTQQLYQEFIGDFYLAKLVHPTRAATFHYGDCTEPGFLDRTKGRPDLVQAIETLLDVDFKYQGPRKTK
jgi:hypothetical protein